MTYKSVFSLFRTRCNLCHLRENHPGVKVYNQCTNLCLQHAIDAAEGKNPRPLKSLGDKTSLPRMPKPGEVDFIYGGA
jgi:DNA (cytosine-5)-methyltransferase 1